MSTEELQQKQHAERTSKKYTLQRVLDEKQNKCFVLFKYFNEPEWVQADQIKKTNEYLTFKKRKQEIEKEKSRKRKRSE